MTVERDFRDVAKEILDGMGLDYESALHAPDPATPWYFEEGDFYSPEGVLMSGSVPGAAKECVYGDVRFPVISREQSRRMARHPESPAERQQRIAKNRERCFSGEFRELASDTFAVAAPDTEAEVIGECRGFCEAFAENRDRNTGRGIILLGEVGRGKTFMASCIANDLIDQGYRCSMTSTRRIRGQVERNYGTQNEVIEQLCRFDAVVLDDLFRDRDTSWGRELVFDVVDALYKMRVPVIVTTNMRRERLFQPREEDRAVVDRLKERCAKVEFRGPNRRQVRA